MRQTTLGTCPVCLRKIGIYPSGRLRSHSPPRTQGLACGGKWPVETDLKASPYRERVFLTQHTTDRLATKVAEIVEPLLTRKFSLPNSTKSFLGATWTAALIALRLEFRFGRVPALTFEKAGFQVQEAYPAGNKRRRKCLVIFKPEA